MKILQTVFSLIALTAFAMSQTPDSVNFFPAHAGDVRQYRSKFTGEITFTQFFTKDSTDQYKNMFIWYNNNFGGTGVYKIDSVANLYELYSPTDTGYLPLLYKLSADTGMVWTYLKDPWDSVLAKVVEIFPGFVFGKEVTVKKIEYTRYSEFGAFWLGNRYLATGFGMVQWDIEPSDVYVLTGAIINGVKYGTIVSVERDPPNPQTFDLLRNYPNPFNGSTVISYSISTDTHVNITIYDVLGRTLKTVVDERKQKGQFEFNFEANRITGGAYFAVLRTNTGILIHKMLYLK